MARPVHPHLSPVVERMFSAADHTFGIPKSISCDGSQEFRDVSALEALIRALIDLVYGALPPRPGRGTDV